MRSGGTGIFGNLRDAVVLRRKSLPAGEECAVCQRIRGAGAGLLRWILNERDRLVLRHATGKSDVVYQFEPRDYRGSRRRRYLVHLPPKYQSRGELPLVMVLHGCRQTEADIRRISDFDAVADREGFIVVYPYVTSYSGMRNRNCWGWWFRDEIQPGSGEVEDLWQIIREVCDRYRVDQRRIHVTGLSSGGGMAVAMMVAHANRIASGAVVAGVPYGETARAVGMMRFNRGSFRPVSQIAHGMERTMGRRKRAVPIFIVHSHDDATVNIQAAHNIRDSWGACFHVGTENPMSLRMGIVGKTPWEHKKYRDVGRRTLIETLYLWGVGHGWYGGKPGHYSYTEAPDISSRIWAFFRDHTHEALLMRGSVVQFNASRGHGRKSA